MITYKTRHKTVLGKLLSGMHPRHFDFKCDDVGKLVHLFDVLCKCNLHKNSYVVADQHNNRCYQFSQLALQTIKNAKKKG